MATQVSAVRVTASGSVWGQPGRVRAISFLAGASAGLITLRDGGVTGPIIATIDTPGSATWQGYIKLPSLGLKFSSTIYVVFTNVTAATFFIG